jgi:hypothetical protein
VDCEEERLRHAKQWQQAEAAQYFLKEEQQRKAQLLAERQRTVDQEQKERQQEKPHVSHGANVDSVAASTGVGAGAGAAAAAAVAAAAGDIKREDGIRLAKQRWRKAIRQVLIFNKISTGSLGKLAPSVTQIGREVDILIRHAVYRLSSSGDEMEAVTVVKRHSDAEGGGFTIFVPSLNREKQTVSLRDANAEYNVFRWLMFAASV